MAQTGSGAVTGIAKDTSSAVIAGAQVTITNAGPMRKYSATTNGVGSHVEADMVIDETSAARHTEVL